MVIFFLFHFVGLAFWKSPRRKLFAVIGTDGKRSIVLDSDDDDFEPTRKRLRTENKLDLVLDSMDSIKRDLKRRNVPNQGHTHSNRAKASHVGCI